LIAKLLDNNQPVVILQDLIKADNILMFESLINEYLILDKTPELGELVESVFVDDLDGDGRGGGLVVALS
jgi:hypothetical protein